MKHLTFEEMTKFVSAASLDDDTVALMRKVNGHICVCKECREKINALQSVEDGFASVCRQSAKNDRRFEKCGEQNVVNLLEKTDLNKKTAEKTPQMRKK